MSLPCPSPDCNSSDAYSIQDNGWGHCFSCGVNVPPGRDPPIEVEREKKITDFTPVVEYSAPFPERGFSKETIQRYKVQIGGEYTSPAGKTMPAQAKYPLFSPDG